MREVGLGYWEGGGRGGKKSFDRVPGEGRGNFILHRSSDLLLLNFERVEIQLFMKDLKAGIKVSGSEADIVFLSVKICVTYYWKIGRPNIEDFEDWEELFG